MKQIAQYQDGRLELQEVPMPVAPPGGVLVRTTHSVISVGTEKMKAKPFLRPALENNAQAVSDKFVAETNAELDKLMAAPEP